MYFQFNLEKIKTTYLNYGSQFWAGKKCNICQEQFTLANYQGKQIELIFSQGWKVDEYCGSEGVEVKWYHLECLTCLDKKFEKTITMLKNYPI